MRLIEAQTIQAIRDLFWLPEYSGTYWRSANMEVLQAHDGLAGTFNYERVIKVELHGNVICKLWPADQILEVSDCGWRTNTTKSRINVLLSCLCGDGKKSPGVYQQAGEWFLSNGVPWQGRHKFPYGLNSDNWSLNLAEKKAAVRGAGR
tara:strand:- start:62 stop:508 length:447 start_codon:yes stop_codon:yes gene_type:complete